MLCLIFYSELYISPGARGTYYTSDGFFYGGGGGGVLVNNDGPGLMRNKFGIKGSFGEGYGAGGTFRVGFVGGRPGVILIEVIKR